MIFECKLPIGIGDFVLSYSILEQIKNKYSEIRVCPDYKLVKSYRGGSKESLEFVEKITSTIYSDYPYKTLKESVAKYMQVVQLANHLSLATQYVNLQKKFCFSTKVNIGTDDYIVISTKARHISQESFDIVKKDVFSILRNSTKKIVLIGERTVEFYERKDLNIRSIYPDLVHALDGIKYIDLTKDVIMSRPDFDNFKKDLTISRDAKAVITFGVSGMTTMLASTSNFLAGYRNDSSSYKTDLMYINGFHNNMGSNRIISDDKDKFLSHLRLLCL
jgi:hypothetical protein